MTSLRDVFGLTPERRDALRLFPKLNAAALEVRNVVSILMNRYVGIIRIINCSVIRNSICLLVVTQARID